VRQQASGAARRRGPRAATRYSRPAHDQGVRSRIRRRTGIATPKASGNAQPAPMQRRPTPEEFQQQHERLENGRTERRRCDTTVTTRCGSGELTGDGSRRFQWKGRVESHCETIKFIPYPTGGQVVAGSSPVNQTLSTRHCEPDTVSPTQVRSHFRTKLLSLIGPRTPTGFCTSRAFPPTC
jgi:hypothetical protein